jgi:hypothetical protein
MPIPIATISPEKLGEDLARKNTKTAAMSSHAQRIKETVQSRASVFGSGFFVLSAIVELPIFTLMATPGYSSAADKRGIQAARVNLANQT